MILALAFFFIILCYKWGEWRNWKYYYPTILFLIAGDFIALFVSSAKPLWRYNSTTAFSGIISQLIVALIIYPSTVLIFVSTYQQLKKNRLAYTSLWVCFYSVLEYLGVKYNYFSYYNGWNFAYSIIFNIILFTLLVVHQNNAPKAWLLSFITGLGVTLWFGLPALY